MICKYCRPVTGYLADARTPYFPRPIDVGVELCPRHSGELSDAQCDAINAVLHGSTRLLMDKTVRALIRKAIRDAASEEVNDDR